MNVYSRETVVNGVTIRQYLTDQGVPIHGNRAVATWRGGKRDSVSFTESVYFDHVADKGGSIIDLFLLIEGGTPLGAIHALGDRYHLTPTKVSVKPKKATRGEVLVSEGFKLAKSYEYQNADGTARYWVDRYEKAGDDGKRVKEFVQRTDKAENLNGVKKTIYHLPAVIAADKVFVVEGEKDADTLTRMGLTATTNSGGAKYWEAAFNEFFAGKDVVILPDNDPAGQEHGRRLYAELRRVAKSVRTCTISKLPKGDVTDWMEKEGGSLAGLIEAVAAAVQPMADTPEVAEARIANATPLVNYTVEREWEDEHGKKHQQRAPRRVDDIVAEMKVRFLGFPKKIGSVLFDYTRPAHGERKILNITTKDELKAWANGTSRHQSDFASGSAFAQWAEVMARIAQTCPAYNGIAHAPWFPMREDVFATYATLPEPDPTHALFDALMAFFLPATAADETLMRSFFLAPMFNTEGARPSFIVDTVDAQGSGKTTVVKACGWIYDESPIDIDLKTMDGDITHVKKRILSPEGRAKRIALFDNVSSAFKSSNLANLVTAQTITGMAPYGHGEETRKNDITWCATMNGARVDSDMATRSYTIRIRAPEATADPLWEKRLREFIAANRPQLHADMLEMLRTAKARRRAKSRFGEFDAVVLSAAAGDDDARFAAADEAICSAALAANDDADLAAQCVEAIVNALAAWTEKDTDGLRTDAPVVLRCTDVDDILSHTRGGVKNWTSRTVRKFVNAGQIKNIVKGVERIDTADARRFVGKARCVIFAGNEALLSGEKVLAQYVTFKGGVPKRVGEGLVAGNGL